MKTASISTRPALYSIGNPQARLNELAWQIAHCEALTLLPALLFSFADPYPPIRHLAADAMAERLNPDLEIVLQEALRHPMSLQELLREGLRTMDLLEPREDLDWATIPNDLLKCETRVTAVSSALCLALAGGQLDSSEEVLLDVLERHSEGDVRFHALRALFGREASSDRFYVACQTLLSDEDPDIAVLSAQIVSAQGWLELGPQIEAVAQQSDEPKRLRLTLELASLFAQFQALEVETPSSEKAAFYSPENPTYFRWVTDLVGCLQDKYLVEAAAHALTQLRAQAAAATIRQRMRKRFLHPLIRLTLARCLVELQDPEGEIYLRKAIKRRRRDVRGYAIQIAGDLQLESLRPGVLNEIESNGVHISTALEALSEYSDHQAQTELRRFMLEHPIARVREYAAELLREHRDSNSESVSA